MFVGHLAQQGLAHTSIKVYLSAVRSLHVAAGQHKEFAQQLTPRLQQVLTGVKKESAPRRPRLPITLEIMRKLKSILLKQPNDHDNILMWAACCLAFFGFLRCGEFTMPAKGAFDVEVHLTPSDLAVDSRHTPSVIQVTIKRSKTDPFRQGVQLYLGRTGTDICPVRAILPYLSRRGPTPGPLFILANKQHLTRERFAARVTATLRAAGVPDKGYTTHSFRIGAATTAKEAGISDVHIKMLGRWKSDAYQLYVRTPKDRLAKLSKQMVTAEPEATD